MNKLPAVGSLINDPLLKDECKTYGREIVTFCIRKVLNKIRKDDSTFSKDEILDKTLDKINNFASPSLQSVINATGIILHTNLGRAPLGEQVLKDITPIIKGYSNLEFNLIKGKRGHRNHHLNELMQLVTGAEEAVLVNNTAAALILIMSTFSKGMDSIVSRGELIEIGGSFRIPEIMSAADANMLEVGTTNRTRISDYENAISDNTGILFKAHLSNFKQTGFVEEASISELVSLSQKNNIPFVYDIGSGLLRKPKFLKEVDEPIVEEVVKMGCDMVTFSADKLLGGPQGGVVVGKSKYIKQLLKSPLMRALRPCKLSISALESACKNYLNEEALIKNNPAFAMLNDSDLISKKNSSLLKKQLKKHNIQAKEIKGEGQSGGGTLPDFKIQTTAVEVKLDVPNNFHKKDFHDKVFREMMINAYPVIPVLRAGSLIFETITISEEDCKIIPKTLQAAIIKVTSEQANE